jgi:hypothetical protein
MKLKEKMMTFSIHDFLANPGSLRGLLNRYTQLHLSDLKAARVDVIEGMLNVNPDERWSAEVLMNHLAVSL